MTEGLDSDPVRKSGYLKLSLQLFTIAIFSLIIVYFMRKYADDFSNLQYLSLLDVLVIGAWSFVSYASYAYAVYVVLVDVGLKGLSPFGWLRIYFVSRLVNLFITQGGNVFRVVLLKRKFAFSYTNSIGVTVFLIWINALIALAASMIVLLSRDQSLTAGRDNLLGIVFLATLMIMLGPLVLTRSIHYFRNSSAFQSRFLKPFGDVAAFFESSLRKTKLLSHITLLSIVHFAFFVGVNYISFRAVGQPTDVGVVCLFTAAFVFTRYVNIVPGNLGISELVGGLVSEQIGIGFANGVLVTGIIRVVEVLLVALIGLGYGNRMAIRALRR